MFRSPRLRPADALKRSGRGRGARACDDIDEHPSDATRAQYLFTRGRGKSGERVSLHWFGALAILGRNSNRFTLYARFAIPIFVVAGAMPMVRIKRVHPILLRGEDVFDRRCHGYADSFPIGIVKVTIVRRDVTQYGKIVAGFMTQERATPSTKPSVFLCMFRG
jgi:hypothetical protein